MIRHNGGDVKTLGDEERERTLADHADATAKNVGVGPPLLIPDRVTYTHPIPYVIENTVTADGQSVTIRYSAPTPEECLRLKRMDEMDAAVAGAMEAEEAKETVEAESRRGMDLLGRHLKGMCGGDVESDGGGGDGGGARGSGRVA